MTRSGLRLCSRSTLAKTCTVVVGLALGPALAQMTWTRGEPARKFDLRAVGAGMGTAHLVGYLAAHPRLEHAAVALGAANRSAP